MIQVSRWLQWIIKKDSPPGNYTDLDETAPRLKKEKGRPSERRKKKGRVRRADGCVGCRLGVCLAVRKYSQMKARMFFKASNTDGSAVKSFRLLGSGVYFRECVCVCVCVRERERERERNGREEVWSRGVPEERARIYHPTISGEKNARRPDWGCGTAVSLCQSWTITPWNMKNLFSIYKWIIKPKSGRLKLC